MSEVQGTQSAGTQPANTVATGKKKSMGIAVVLALLFGPLGLLYANIAVGFIMLFGALFTACTLWATEPGWEITDAEMLGLFFWFVSVVLSIFVVRHHNRQS